jgi:hypothetical protein
LISTNGVYSELYRTQLDTEMEIIADAEAV